MSQLPRRKFSIRTKIHILGTVLFVILLAVGGIGVGSVYRSIRAELFHWFEVSGQNLASSISRNTVEYVFPYYEPTLDVFLRKTIDQDPNLLYCRVDFGDNLSEHRSVGAPAENNYLTYRDTVADNAGNPISAVTIQYSTASIEQKLNTLIVVIVVAALTAFLLIVAALDFFLSRYVTRPLGKLADLSHTVAQGDLNRDIDIHTGDEMEQVAEAFNRMTANLRTTVERLSNLSGELTNLSAQTEEVSAAIASDARTQAGLLEQASESIGHMDTMLKGSASNVENLFAAIGQSASSTVEMSSSIGEVTRTAGSLSQSVDTYASTIQQITASIGTVADGINLLDTHVTRTSGELEKIDQSLHAMSEAAIRSKELSNKVSALVTADGQATVRRAIEGFQNIRAAVEEGVGAITRLGEEAEGIGSVIDVISDLAEQTNLLSLNAAIIAAQAGEHGRSFAVVADEIRELAERTSSYLGEISRNIRSVQGQAGKTVTAITKGSRTVEEGVALIGEVDKTFRKVAEDSAEASAAAQAIAEASSRSAGSAETIAAAARSMATMSREIATATREQAVGTNQMLEEVANMHVMALQVNQAMREQEGAARMISQSAESARAMTELIRDATVAEARHSERIVASIENLKKASESGLNAFAKLDEMVRRVNDSTGELNTHLKRFKT